MNLTNRISYLFSCLDIFQLISEIFLFCDKKKILLGLMNVVGPLPENLMTMPQWVKIFSEGKKSAFLFFLHFCLCVSRKLGLFK